MISQSPGLHTTVSLLSWEQITGFPLPLDKRLLLLQVKIRLLGTTDYCFLNRMDYTLLFSNPLNYTLLFPEVKYLALWTTEYCFSTHLDYRLLFPQMKYRVLWTIKYWFPIPWTTDYCFPKRKLVFSGLQTTACPLPMTTQVKNRIIWTTD